MDTLEEFKNVSPLRSPSLASTAPATPNLVSMRSLESSRTFLSTPPSPMRSGRTSPLPGMSVTEQIARQTRKSTVLDQKNALMILAIPDYDDYKIMQPYSCRSLSNKSKFTGEKDFITRHNPQEVDDFKKQYSRDVGNLGRQRSVLAPPDTLLADAVLASPSGSKKGFTLAGFQTMTTLSSNQLRNDDSPDVWKRILTTGKKPCWILTEYGINKLIGPEYRITTRASLTSEPSPQVSRSLLRPHTPADQFTGRDSARIGMGVNLTDDGSLGVLSRSAMYSPASRPPSPLRSPYREPAVSSPRSLGCEEPRSTRHGRRFEFPFMDNSPQSTVSGQGSPLRTKDIFHVGSPISPIRGASSPTLLPFAMEVSPPCIAMNHLAVGEVYIFPVRVRNVGSKQERFRVKHISASGGGHSASIAEATYDKDSARLASGLAAIITVTLSFGHRGLIVGELRVETEGVGCCIVSITGSVR